MCAFLNVFLNQVAQQMTNKLVHLLIKIHANLRSYSNNASHC